MVAFAIPFIAKAQEEDDPIPEKVVNLENVVAGHLQELLEADDMEQITDLTISGELNGSDIACLKRISRKPSQYDYEQAGGVLSKLNLSKARIVEGGEAYGYDNDYGGTGEEFYTENDVIGPFMFYGCNLLESLVLPESTKKIGNNAFENLEKIKNLIIPDNVTYIGESAFRQCKKLQNIALPDNITEIRPYTFSGCENLQTVKFPANLITIGEMSFLSCKALEQVILPQKLETIGMSAFVNCELISKISIPSSIKELKRTAFGNCTNTQEIYSYAQNPPTCGDNVFMNIDTENCKLYVPANTTDIYKANSTFEPFINIIEMGETLQLDENGINSGKLYRNENKTLNVELKKTFKAGEWSSICLPFSLDNSQMKQYFGEDVVLKELDRFGSVENGEPEMSLVMKDAESIAAGNPYIIKTSVDTDVLLFENITIEKSLTNQVVPEGKLYCVFAGTFNLTDMLSSGNYLVNSDGTLTIAPTYSEELQEFNVPGFSAYFMMPDEWFEKEVTLILDTKPDVETLQLDENGINSGKLYRNENKTLNVELKKTFKAGEWSSICLPFSLDNSQMKQYFGEDVVLKELDRFGSVENGEPEMSLVMKDAESIAAGNPYIIKTSVDTDVLLFENITIEKSLTNQVVPEGKLYCVFAGTFNLTDMLSSGNYLVNSDGTLTIAPTYSEELQEFNVPGFSAYFMMPDEWFEKEVTLILDKIETSINTIKTTESNKYFNLQGHEMGTDSRKLPKGIYINNGKKIVIK